VLLAYDPNLEACNDVQHTPFMVAAMQQPQSCKAMSKLLERGADRFYTTPSHQTALGIVVSGHSFNTGQVLDLIMGKAPFDTRCLQLAAQRLPDQRTVLHLACSSGNSHATSWLLRNSVVDIHAETVEGDTPLIKVSQHTPACAEHIWA